MENLETFFNVVIVILAIVNICMIVAFFKLCSNVDKLTKKFCPEPQLQVSDPDKEAENLPPFEVGDHVMDDDVELIVADRNGNYYKCNRADNSAFYAVMHRAHLKPANPKP